MLLPCLDCRTTGFFVEGKLDRKQKEAFSPPFLENVMYRIEKKMSRKKHRIFYVLADLKVVINRAVCRKFAYP